MRAIAKCWKAALLAAVAGSGVYAQSPISKYIGSATQDHTLQAYTEQIGYLDTKPYRLSPLQKLEFRTTSNQLDPQRQGYAIRVNPANPWELSNNNDYFREYKEALLLKKDEAFREALSIRYLDAIQLMYYNEMKAIRVEDKKLIETRLAILEKQKLSAYFDADDYVNLTLDQLDREVELEETDFERTTQLHKMAGLFPGMEQNDGQWRFADVLSVTQMEHIVDSLNGQSLVSPLLAYREKQIALAEREYKLEKSNINVGYIQAQYQHYRIEQDRKPWSISLGVTIPIVNPNKGDMTKRKLDGIEAQHEYQETKQQVQTAKMQSYTQVKDLIRRYGEMEIKIKALRNGTLPGSLATLKENNPSAIVRFNSNILKLTTIQVKLKQSILESYVEFLAQAGALHHFPLTNYLSPRLEAIDN